MDLSSLLPTVSATYRHSFWERATNNCVKLGLFPNNCKSRSMRLQIQIVLPVPERPRRRTVPLASIILLSSSVKYKHVLYLAVALALGIGITKIDSYTNPQSSESEAQCELCVFDCRTDADADPASFLC